MTPFSSLKQASGGLCTPLSTAGAAAYGGVARVSSVMVNVMCVFGVPLGVVNVMCVFGVPLGMVNVMCLRGALGRADLFNVYNCYWSRAALQRC